MQNKKVDNIELVKVENLLEKYNEFPTAMQGLGYKEVVEYLQGKTSKEEMIEKIKRETRRYAKRQLTWFKRDKNIKWFDISKLNSEELIKNVFEYIDEAKDD